MIGELRAQFEKRYRRGPSIQAELRQPAGKFSITVLVGPSGCGKSTILRCLAGLERPESGMIRFGEDVWFDAQRSICRLPQQRNVGYLFQEYALFPHMTVAANIAYGLAADSPSARRRRVGEMLERFELQGLEHRRPHQVSGGQQQRIALARVLARRPRLLLLDEPLSALDTTTRETLRTELRRQLADFDIPVVLVTHDRVETIALADQVIVLDEGGIRQCGDVHAVFTRPADLAVARIVGVETVEPAQVVAVEDGLATIVVGTARLTAKAPENLGREAYACIRAEEVIIQRAPIGPTSARNRLEGRIRSAVAEGPMVRIELDCGFSLTAIVTRHACEELGLREGEIVIALLKAPSIHLISRG